MNMEIHRRCRVGTVDRAHGEGRDKDRSQGKGQRTDKGKEKDTKYRQT